MQFARNAPTLFFLGFNNALRQDFLLHIREPPLMQIDRQPRHKHREQGKQRNAQK